MSPARLVLALAALVAVLAIAPPAWAITYPVDDPDDTAEVAPDGICDAPGADTCTLREAILEANFTPGADTITFTGGGTAPAPVAALPLVDDQLLIDGGGATTVTFAATATGSMLDLQAANSTLRSITLRGGGAGVLVNAGASGVQLSDVAVADTAANANGIHATGTGVRLDGVSAQGIGSNAIHVPGSNVTISSPFIRSAGRVGIEIAGSGVSVTDPDIAGVAGDGMRLTGVGTTVSRGSIRGNNGHGVAISGQNNTVTRVTFYSNGGRPVSLGPGANGGIQPPQNLRIGPRRADGSLPLTGTANGTVELWTGNPGSTGVPTFLDALSAGGDFAYSFASEPAPGTVFSAMTISGGSSEFATVAVPSDVASPEIRSARALDTERVRVDPTETLDPASVQKEDFALNMAGADRAITDISVAPDGSFVTLVSSGWREGEAGYVQVVAPGAVTDPSGNQSQTAPRLRVAAAPGDFRSPLGAKLAIRPKTICLTRGRRCRRPGMTIRFETPEPGKATIVIKRGNKIVGRRTYGNIVAGQNRLKFNGRLNARKLRAGRYRFLLYLQDMVGNVTDQPPITLFSVRRTTR